MMIFVHILQVSLAFAILELAKASKYNGDRMDKCNFSGDSRCICDTPTPVPNLIGYEISGCNPLFAIIDLGIEIFPVTKITYNWYLGQRAELDFMDTYAYIINLRSIYYYISVVNNACPKLVKLTNSTTAIIPSTTIKHSVAQFLLQRFLVPYGGNCDVIVPLSSRDFPSSPCPTDVPDCPYRNQFETAVSAYLVTSKNGNDTNSAVNQTIYKDGLKAEITANTLTGDYLIQLVENVDNECCEPAGCKRLDLLKNATQMIHEAGYDIRKIRPENTNSPCLLSQSIAQGFTLAYLPFTFTYFVMAIVTPASCAVKIVKFGGPTITDAFRRLLLRFFTFCY